MIFSRVFCEHAFLATADFLTADFYSVYEIYIGCTCFESFENTGNIAFCGEVGDISGISLDPAEFGGFEDCGDGRFYIIRRFSASSREDPKEKNQPTLFVNNDTDNRRQNELD